METGFVKADSKNLPRIDAIMVGLYFQKNPDFYAAQSKNVKTPTESLGDDAVGYVQLFRESGICTMKCKMCTEHKDEAKYYSVTLVVDENNGNIISCQCHDCTTGGCLHAVAFLMWTHRRSEDPFSTSVKSYWKKPKISQMGSLKYITVDQLVTKNDVCYASDNGLLLEFLQEAKQRAIENCELLKYKPDDKDDQPSNLVSFSFWE